MPILTQQGFRHGDTIYSSKKPEGCTARVEYCTDCPYDDCRFNPSTGKMNVRKERGIYKKKGDYTTITSIASLFTVAF